MHAICTWPLGPRAVKAAAVAFLKAEVVAGAKVAGAVHAKGTEPPARLHRAGRERRKSVARAVRQLRGRRDGRARRRRHSRAGGRRHRGRHRRRHRGRHRRRLRHIYGHWLDLEVDDNYLQRVLRNRSERPRCLLTAAIFLRERKGGVWVLSHVQRNAVVREARRDRLGECCRGVGPVLGEDGVSRRRRAVVLLADGGAVERWRLAAPDAVACAACSRAAVADLHTNEVTIALQHPLRSLGAALALEKV